jgi:hypothetical protein
MMRTIAWAWAIPAALACATTSAAQTVTLQGVLTGADAHVYREIPFRVPDGVRRMTVEVEYSGKDQHTTLDFGLFDPRGFRGWSGGNKSRFTLAATDATPSYLAGPLPPGRWRLIIGTPNIRAGATARWQAHIAFEEDDTPPTDSLATPPLRPGAGWYRGDLHMHTAHSDGTCASQSGARTPCPVFKTVQAAAARQLDFIVVSDHNTVSQNGALRELRPLFDRLLLIPGEEVTTFEGHAGLLGPSGFVDFRLGAKATPTIGALLNGAQRANALVIINHPALPSGEACMGCGWSAADTPYAQVTGVEVVNGGALGAQGGLADGPVSGLPFWEARLNAGFRLTAVGGSDNHDPDLAPNKPGAVGYPTTVVWASELSQAAILEGIRAGHVFIDVEGAPDRLLEVAAASGARSARMGDRLVVADGSAAFTLRAVGVEGGRWRLVEDGKTLRGLAETPIDSSDSGASFTLPVAPGHHWLRVEVRSADGRKTLLIGNPVYLEGS